MEVVSETRCFDGVQGVYRHPSKATGTEMTFGLFMPQEAQDGPVPILWFLSGLTCTHENAMIKAGAQCWAAEAGIALAYPDTSPRGHGVADDESYDLGLGAGFYVDATQAPWAPHFMMESYVIRDLPDLIMSNFQIDEDRQAITGHSMGGHGALTLGMRHPGRFRSLSAFAPICNPMASDWGRKQMTAYLGPDETAWSAHDASALMADRGFDGPILVDTGAADSNMDLLRPETLAQAIAARRQQATWRLQPGYDHSYFFVASFMEEHIAFHAEALWA